MPTRVPLKGAPFAPPQQPLIALFRPQRIERRYIWTVLAPASVIGIIEIAFATAADITLPANTLQISHDLRLRLRKLFETDNAEAPRQEIGFVGPSTCQYMQLGPRDADIPRQILDIAGRQLIQVVLALFQSSPPSGDEICGLSLAARHHRCLHSLSPFLTVVSNQLLSRRKAPRLRSTT